MTKYAEQLIRAVARAFFTDEYVLVIDVLIRDRFLRDDDMGPRLKLGTKGLKKVLERLEKEMLVKKESGELGVSCCCLSSFCCALCILHRPSFAAPDRSLNQDSSLASITQPTSPPQWTI